jgi:hypothetical protein
MKGICLLVASLISSLAMAGTVSQPELKTYDLVIYGCSADRHLVRAHFRLSNFSPYDLNLPQGYVWASEQDHHKASTAVFSEDFMPEVNAVNDQTIQSQTFFQDVALKEVIVEDTDQNGHVIHGKTTLMTKIFIDIKKRLMTEGKYAGSALNFAKSSLEVDTHSPCAF